jgi:hypothetical protein
MLFITLRGGACGICRSDRMHYSTEHHLMPTRLADALFGDEAAPRGKERTWIYRWFTDVSVRGIEVEIQRANIRIRL